MPNFFRSLESANPHQLYRSFNKSLESLIGALHDYHHASMREHATHFLLMVIDQALAECRNLSRHTGLGTEDGRDLRRTLQAGLRSLTPAYHISRFAKRHLEREILTFREIAQICYRAGLFVLNSPQDHNIRKLNDALDKLLQQATSATAYQVDIEIHSAASIHPEGSGVPAPVFLTPRPEMLVSSPVPQPYVPILHTQPGKSPIGKI